MNRPADSTHTIRLSSGRRLGFTEFGARDGRPVLYCHGMPGSRLEPCLFQSEAAQRGLRVIGVERPGYGITSPLPGRIVGDEVADTASLADRLELERFDVIGFSGGGPQALACAAHMPDRVGRVSLVGSWAPFEAAGLDGMVDGYRQLWTLAQSDFAAFVQTLRDAIGQAGGGYELLLAGAAASDQAILEQAEFAQPYKWNLDEALSQDLAGMLEDAAAVVSEWSFDCADVGAPVRIFHGEHDGNAPVGMARWLAERLPSAELNVWPEAMHFEAFRRWGEVLEMHDMR